MSLLSWLWSFLPDKCEMKLCSRKGIRGNENIVDGKIMCDYCHHLYKMFGPVGMKDPWTNMDGGPQS